MRRGMIATGAVAVAVASLALTACGTDGTRHQTASPTVRRGVGFSYATAYTSLHGLRADSKAVAVVSPTGQSNVTQVGNVPFTISTVKVVEVLSGGPLPNVLSLRQTGDARTSAPEFYLLQQGRQYIVYLVPFSSDNGQWVTTGAAQGIWASSTSSNPDQAPSPSQQFDRVIQNDQLPSSLTPQEASAS